MQDLRYKFEKYGYVTEARVVMGRAGESKGFGFVTFEKEADAEDVSSAFGCIPLSHAVMRFWCIVRELALDAWPLLMRVLLQLAQVASSMVGVSVAAMQGPRSTPDDRLRQLRPARFFKFVCRMPGLIVACFSFPQAIYYLDKRDWDGRRLLVEKAKSARH